MTVEDVFFIRGRGTIVTGAIEAGTLNLNDEVQIQGSSAGRKAVVVMGIEKFRLQLDRAQAGDNVGVLLSGVEKQDVKRGDLLVGS